MELSVKDVKEMYFLQFNQETGDSDTRAPLWDSLGRRFSLNSPFVFLFKWRGRFVYCILLSSINQPWGDVREPAWGCSGMVHSYLHRWTVLALTWQLSGSSNAKPLMKKVQISWRSTLMLPLHIRQLSVWQQEVIAQIYVHKATTHFYVL